MTAWPHTHGIDQVAEFHRAFSHPIGDRAVYGCVFQDVPALVQLRTDLILEEAHELRDAGAAGDVIAYADALADILYVTYGACLALGVPIAEVFAEVHRSNMAKLGPDGVPIYREDGKVLKPEGWSPPDIRDVLLRHCR